MYQVVFSRQALKDRRLIARAGLEQRAKALLDTLILFSNKKWYL